MMFPNFHQFGLVLSVIIKCTLHFCLPVLPLTENNPWKLQAAPLLLALFLSGGIKSAGLEFDYNWLFDVIHLGRDFRTTCRDLAIPLGCAKPPGMPNPPLRGAWLYSLSE